MKVTGIISEFNPFHNGHKYLIDSVRRDLKPDAIVCVMSGNFVQRGEAALWDKRNRAAMAVSCGADLVLELPVCFAVNGASEFAFGGVALLGAIGADTLAFGSECGDIKLIKEIADLTAEESSDFSGKIRSLMDKGLSYPDSYARTVSELYPGFLDGSNNILALEYLKQMKKQGINMDAYTVKRYKAEHDSTDADGDFASASFIRSGVCEGVDVINILKRFVPEQVLAYAENSLYKKSSNDRLFSILKYRILTLSSPELASVLEVGEGLENKLKKEILSADSLDDFILRVKSKRYTYARIQRILMQLLLGITKEKYDMLKHSAGAYANVLAANRTGLDLLHEFKKRADIRLISNPDKSDPQLAENPSHQLDTMANDIYSVISGRNIYKNSDYVCSPCLIGIK